VTKVLDGFRVLEVSMWGYVPSAGAVLADWGAEVVKVEHPTGDPIRGLVLSGLDPAKTGVAFMWDIFNRGKRSVAVDVGHPDGRELILRLVERSDVFLTSFLPAARKRLGIDVDDVRRRNPRIVYATGSGQGPRGAESEKGGYDAISFWSRCGIASAATPPESEWPVGMPAGAFGDTLSGALLAGGIAAALGHRDRTGEAVTVDGSLLASGAWAMQTGIAGSAVLGMDEMPRRAREAMPNPLVNTYKTSDGRHVMLCMLQSDRYWEGFCTASGRPDLVSDARFATADARAANSADCVKVLDDLFSTRTLEEWREVLGSQEGQWDVIQRAGELPDDGQVRANGYIQDVGCSGAGTLPMVAAPIQFDRTPPDLRPAPELGADTEAVMLELGMEWDDIVRTKEAGAVI
jgi:crotonobetainyl-CoA:carnitine CoA-transferase CaiB-like acyl-CoA transferase